VQQVEGMFDVVPGAKSETIINADLPIDEKDWEIGLIVGASGSGKTTVANEIFKDHIYNEFNWSANGSILDDLPKSISIKEIISTLSSVGFSSPPSWLRPYGALSTGEKFRVSVARALLESKDICVIDEFTSVVDRVVAKIGSCAVAKTIRRNKKKFVAVSCHSDIIEWLQPDWIYRPATNEFQWRFLQQRPAIDLRIRKVHRSAWELFKRHHYLTAKISNAAQCFLATWEGVPVAFFSYIHFVNNRLNKTKSGHRVVVLPDYQGVSIGNRLMEHVASCLRAIGFDYIGRSASPAIINYWARSTKWTMIRKPEVASNKGGRGRYNRNPGRMVATSRFVGPPWPDVGAARALIAGE
jgi:ABC-type lipoprotein export system ATPase subunit